MRRSAALHPYLYRIHTGRRSRTGKGIPLKIDLNGIYIIPLQERSNSYADVYLWRWGANSLEGPVTKCDNKAFNINRNSWAVEMLLANILLEVYFL